MLEAGAVLMDNTTVFGARSAFDAWPPNSEEWTSGPLSVDLRSLMDLLEALVLHEQIVVDNGSRSYDLWPSLPWLEVGDLTTNDPDVRRVLAERDLVVVTTGEDGSPEIVSSLVLAALDTLGSIIVSGQLARELSDLRTRGTIAALPPFYRSTEDFVDLMHESYGEVLNDKARARLGRLGETLGGASPELTNFALFAFRGFFYQQLAHLASVSYVPHSWRTSLISSALSNPEISFVQYVAALAAELRSELAAQLNSEFGAAAIQGEFPVFASFIANQATSRPDLIRVAVDLRATEAAVAFRRWIQEMEANLHSQTDLPRIAAAQGELQGLLSDLRRETGLSKQPEYQQSVTLKVGLPTVGSVDLPTTISMSRPSWVRRLMHRRTHLVFLRQVAASSMSIGPFSVAYQHLGRG
jgi:hypothetical protein